MTDTPGAGVAARPGATSPCSTVEVREGVTRRVEDALATEEPLEIRLVVHGAHHPVAVTMRTPGADFELATGFLFNEGIVRGRDHLRRVSYCVDRSLGEEQRFNIVNVELAGDGARVDMGRLERHFSMTSACGVCGKATLDALHQRGYEFVRSNIVLKPEMLWSLPEKLRQAQKLFDRTGGLHAAGLFDADGQLVAVREDVGRHNALDKVVGWALMAGRLPLSDHVVLVSGRSSFELVQKSLSAGVAALCSVSAPSSLAVNLAREFGLSLVGFLRPGRFKLYSGFERVREA